MVVPGFPAFVEPSSDSQKADFARQVHNALAHLYDNAHLESHPLAALCGTGAGHHTRAQRLRRTLLDCIESLRSPPQPQQHSASHVGDARVYAILTYRYVDGLAVDEVCDRLALSRRQFYREHEKGVKAVASLMWDALQPERATGPADSSLLHAISPPAADADKEARARQSAAREEVARLRQARELEPIRVQLVLNETLDLLSPVLEQYNRQVRCRLDTDPIVLADRVMLRQALLMIFNQLLRSAQDDLHLALAPLEGVSRIIIDAQVSPHTDHSPNRRSGPAASDSDGDAVGFSIAQALVAEQGGALAFESAGPMLRVSLSLPAADQPTVLVIDDNADLVSLFQRYLGGHAATVIGAASGEEALRLAHEARPLVITLDVMMPRQDGWDILRQLKQAPETRGIPVCICSVLHEPQLAASLGADGYITKPVDQAEFLAVLAPWLTAPGSAGRPPATSRPATAPSPSW